jgi:hypothetical protein
MRTGMIKFSKEAADLRRRDLDPLSAMTETDQLLKVIGDDELRKKITENVNGNMRTEMRRFSTDTAYLQLSFEKIVRMLNRLQRDGFTSFAEA